jgi:hypothetical protein
MAWERPITNTITLSRRLSPRKQAQPLTRLELCVN